MTLRSGGSVSPARLAFILLILCVAMFGVSSRSAEAQWSLAWGDEFSGASGSAPDPAKWTYDLGNNFGNGEVDCAVNSRQTSYQDGAGNLVIAALFGTFPDCGGTSYVSAHLKTAGLFAAGPYGKIEARIQTAQGPGIGQAFWALGNNTLTSGVPWPWCGELDMMEITWPNRGHNGWTLHGGQTDGNTYFEYGGISATADLPAGQTFDAAFHLFGVQWAPYHLEYFLDGAKVGEVYQHSIGSTDIWPIEQSIYLILGLGVGASNSGTPDGQGYPKMLKADYVHVYTYSAGKPAAPTGLTAVSNNSNAVTLSWTASSTASVTYNIYASTSSAFTANLDTLVAQNVAGTSYTQTGVANGTTYFYRVVASNYGGESSPATAQATTQAPGNSGSVKMSAGGYGVGGFMTAKYVLGGNSNYHYGVNVDTSGVTNPAPAEVYRTERWGAAAWTITDLSPSATYRVRLHFVEYGKTAAGQRLFNMSINNQTVLNNFDIFAAAGAQNKAVVREFDTKADEFGIIELQANYGSGAATVDLNPSISAIEVNPVSSTALVGSAPGSATYLGINSGGGAVGSFVADQGFNGGVIATTTNTIDTSVANAAPMQVYQDQRYVPFTYVMTGLQARAAYTVRMHFAETYWTAAGQRVFNVNVNGTPALTNFDLFATAGAQNKAVVRDFSTRADMYGQIIVQLIYGGYDQPCIQGLEAIETAPPTTPTSTPTATSTPSPTSVRPTATPTATSTPTATPTGTSARPTPTATTPVGTNLALNKPATASSIENAGTTAAMAVDGNTGTRWSSAFSDPQWLSVDLGATAAITRVRLVWEAAYGKTYQIQVSTDNVSWTTIKTQSAGTGGTEDWTGLVGSGRYVRMYGTARGTGYGYSLWEFEVYGTIGGATPTATATPTSTPRPTATSTSTARPTATSTPTSGATVIAINCGGTAASPFVADVDFAGGGTYSTTASITTTGVASPAPQAVYQSARQGAFTYTIPGLAAGSSHTVRLHIAELYFSAAGQRAFNVSINGTAVLTNFDIVAAAGAKNVAVVRPFTATANSSGQIVVSASNGTIDQPMLNGIEVQ
jgi:trimeric autotransporter adhesin